jgi:hypothetical protein
MAAGSEVALLANLTHERLIALGLPGMAKLSKRKGDSPTSPLFFEAALGLMVARAAARHKAARHAPQVRGLASKNAAIEDTYLLMPHGIEPALFQKLVAGDRIEAPKGS